jgi:iron complex outermembrane receptor protein
VDLTTDSIAAFTEWTYDLTDAFSLTGGVRWTSDDKGLRGTVYNVFPETQPDPDPLPDRAIPDGGPLFIYPDWFKDTYEKLTYSVNGQYRISERSMAYASYSTSFKSGGFNQRYNAPPPGFVPVAFDEETVDTLEFGFKSDLTDSLRLNGAVYFSDYDDIQLIYRVGPVPLLFNAGTASIDGVELEFQYVPNSSLIVEGGFSYLDDNIDEVTAVPGASATIGPDDSLPFTPEWQGNLGVGYTFGLSNGLLLTPRIDVSYTDEQFFDVGNTALVAQQDAETVSRLSILLADGDGDWNVGFYVDNLTDELYPVMGNASLATLGYAEIIYARGRNWYVTANYFY